MKELRDKQRLKRGLYSIPSLILLAAIVFFLGRGAGSVMVKERESARTLEALREKNAGLREREEALKEDIVRLHTDEGVIEEIRKKFNVTRPGEHLAIVLDDETAAATSAPGTLEKLKKGWQWLLGLWGK